MKLRKSILFEDPQGFFPRKKKYNQGARISSFYIFHHIRYIPSINEHIQFSRIRDSSFYCPFECIDKFYVDLDTLYVVSTLVRS